MRPVEKEYDFPNRGIHDFVSRYVDGLPDLTGKVVVDIPCGDGRSSYAFALKGATVKAFDLYPEFMKIDGMKAEYADLAGRIPVEDSSVDYLICQEGIEHMPAKISLFREFNRVLRKGGSLIITAPSISHARARLSMFLMESELWRRTPPTEIDSVWFSETNSDRLYFGHLFLVGVQHLQTICTLSGFRIAERVRTRFNITSLILGILFYPLFALGSLLAYSLYKNKNTHVEKNRRYAILWDRAKLNLSPTVIFCKHLFWVLEKEHDETEVLQDLKSLTRFEE